MSALHSYKKIEKSFAKKVHALLGKANISMTKWMSSVIKRSKRSISILVIPHSEKKTVSFKLSMFGFSILLAGFAALMIFVGYSLAHYGTLNAELAAKANSLQTTQSTLDSMRDSVTSLIKTSKQFQVTMDAIFNQIGVNTNTSGTGTAQGDLASIISNSKTAGSSLPELNYVQNLNSYLEQSIDPLTDLSNLIKAQGTILSEFPSAWPVKGGIGHISMYYGQNQHPIFGGWYLHTGIDISTFRSGDPVIATANGKVIYVGYDVGYGNYIIIEHKYGFLTRYAHLKAFAAQKGQEVQQGDIIGYIGNTGISTGPHLHYEIYLGTSRIDPLRFITSRVRTVTTK
ncbi:MAG TPA: M23 family metallopeptidase [Spirochaetia bacterium]|nr:M23 family metallopeptidase [Spirochaetales bacterium]HOT58271.1 M23 family metallopeptidase [Spirochaetales bacterium]HPD80338.1 M23 family metallopeptidase [Spirochaetales bacterium]HRS65135.1 M23 family metallopeptidase [Spirochaetia bacterium]